MFIGRRSVIKTPARGRFRCPHCDASRAYALRRARRFFAILFVPVVPLRGEVEFVQCGFCRRAFPPTILESEATRSVVDPEWDAETRRKLEEATRGAAASRLLVWETEAE